MFAKDEGPRPGTTAESLSKLKCCSGKEGGLVTAGNASGINDGAGCNRCYERGEGKRAWR